MKLIGINIGIFTMYSKSLGSKPCVIKGGEKAASAATAAKTRREGKEQQEGSQRGPTERRDEHKQPLQVLSEWRAPSGRAEDDSQHPRRESSLVQVRLRLRREQRRGRNRAGQIAAEEVASAQAHAKGEVGQAAAAAKRASSARSHRHAESSQAEKDARERRIAWRCQQKQAG